MTFWGISGARCKERFHGDDQYKKSGGNVLTCKKNLHMAQRPDCELIDKMINIDCRSTHLQHKKRPEIVDVGTRRSAHDQVAQCAEKSITVVFIKHRARLQTEPCGALH